MKTAREMADEKTAEINEKLARAEKLFLLLKGENRRLLVENFALQGECAQLHALLRHGIKPAEDGTAQ